MKTRIDVLTEAGFRCSVPGCNHILTLLIHHLVHVAEGGGDTPDNLLALCGNHHDLYHQRHIPEESLRVYQGMQVALFEGFGKQARDQLLFLSLNSLTHFYTSDATLQFVPLVVAGLVELQMQPASRVDFWLTRYKAVLTDRGKAVVDAWKRGDERAWLEAQKTGDG